MSKTINLGRVTAYADAVAAGYTGTREEFAHDLANAANYAAEAGDAAETATNKAEEASTAAETATTKAEEASEDAEQAHADAQAILGAKETAVAAAATATSKAGEAANSAQQAAASETAAAGSATTASNAATSATASKNAAATSETNAANSANAAAQTLTNVNQAGATQVAAIQAKGTEVLNSIPADYTELTQEVVGLKSDLTNGSIYRYNGNILGLATDHFNGYRYKSGSQLVSVESSSYHSFFVEVIPSETYYVTAGRFVVFTDDSKAPIDTNQLENVTSFTVPSNASMACISYEAVDNYYIGTNTIIRPFTVYPDYIIKEKAEERTDFYYTHATGTVFSLPTVKTSVKKNVQLRISAEFSTFSELIVRYLQKTTNVNKLQFVIDDTNLTYTREGGSQFTVAHGLTIKNNIQIVYSMGWKDTYGASFTIVSNGEKFTQDFSNGDNVSAVVTPVIISATSLSNVSVSFSLNDVYKDIWAFGDSYFSYDTSRRWTNYLYTGGYLGNTLLSGYPGETSAGELNVLKTLLSKGTPKYILFATGMNDGSDNGAPNNAWLNVVTEVLNLCNSYGITPILATIPTVPTINHQYKNDWVRQSGYRYIDFANAVGAESDGTWFEGMLSSDNVHPTETGAKALYYQAIADFPELVRV